MVRAEDTDRNATEKRDMRKFPFVRKLGVKQGGSPTATTLRRWPICTEKLKRIPSALWKSADRIEDN
ncbi:hypothetical protein QQP08_013592 [Theobroma cacao]|nr:hypothetical protein QQP08_013592 [Theobroma cacao]